MTVTDDDGAAPTLSTATVNGATLTLTYDELLDTGSVPVAGAFSVRVDGSTGLVSDVEVSGATVMLALGNAVAAGQSVTVAYTVPTGAGANPIQDSSGDDAASFSARSVTNLTPGLVLSASMLSVAEGGTGTYTVRLGTAPSADRDGDGRPDRQHRRDVGPEHAHLHHGELEHGADGDGERRP